MAAYRRDPRLFCAGVVYGLAECIGVPWALGVNLTLVSMVAIDIIILGLFARFAGLAYGLAMGILLIFAAITNIVFYIDFTFLGGVVLYSSFESILYGITVIQGLVIVLLGGLHGHWNGINKLYNVRYLIDTAIYPRIRHN